MTAELVWAVVAAAGDGRRLGAERPKAFVKLGGRPLVAHAIELLEGHPRVEGIVFVVPEGWEEPTALLADELAAGKVAASVAGGATRALSVAAGLDEVAETATVVLVHDAARPFASRRWSPGAGRARGGRRRRPGHARRRHGEAGAATARSPRRSSGRSCVAVQTPQAFRAEALRRAYAGPPDDISAATDCAQLVERTGGRVVVVEGEAANLKITDAGDLARAEAASRGPHERRDSGSGSASTPTRSPRGVRWCWAGLRSRTIAAWPGTPTPTWCATPSATRCSARPASRTSGTSSRRATRRYEGASSLALLGDAWERVRALGWELVNLDAVVIMEEPRIAPHRERMRTAVAGALGVEPGRVTVRATTTDGLGFTGRGEGAACHAVALLRRRD